MKEVNKEDIDLDALEQKARAATPGEWTACIDSHAPGNGKCIAWVETADDYLADMHNGPRSAEDAKYIAAASPDVVLALVARLRAAEASNMELEKESDVWERINNSAESRATRAEAQRDRLAEALREVADASVLPNTIAENLAVRARAALAEVEKP